MKKIVIPAILTATILVAGMFAFMPIEKAATVHTTITGAAAPQLLETGAVAALDATVEITLDCSTDYLVSDVSIVYGAGTDTGDEDVDVTIGGDIIGASIDGFTPSVTIDLAIGAPIAGDAAENLVLDWDAGSYAEGEDIVNARVSVTGG